MVQKLTEYFLHQPREGPPEMVYVNGWAVLAAVAVNVAVGMLWYSPALLGGTWARLRGLEKGQVSGRARAMLVALVAAFVTACVMAYLFAILEPDHVAEGLIAAFLLWLGFTAAFGALDVGFGGKPFGLYLIEAGGQLAALMAMGAVLTIWR